MVVNHIKAMQKSCGNQNHGQAPAMEGPFKAFIKTELLSSHLMTKKTTSFRAPEAIGEIFMAAEE